MTSRGFTLTFTEEPTDELIDGVPAMVITGDFKLDGWEFDTDLPFEEQPPMGRLLMRIIKAIHDDSDVTDRIEVEDAATGERKTLYQRGGQG